MVLFFTNPDRYNGDWLSTLFDNAGAFAGDTGVPDVRSDGENSRPAFTSTGGNSLLEWHADKPYSTLQIHPLANDFRMGGRFLFESWPADPICILGVAAFQGSVQVCATVNPDGTLSIWRGVPGDVDATELKASTATLSLDTFYKLGFIGKVAQAGGMAEIWNGTSRFLTVPNDNTELQENFFWNGWVWGLVEDSAVNHIYGGDSYGHLLATGPAPEKIVASQYPRANGSQVGWTANTGVMYAAVDDGSPDGDITRVEALVSGQRFSVLQSATDALGTVYAMQDTVLVKNLVDDGTPLGMQFMNVDAGGLRTYGVIGIEDSDEYVARRRVYYQRQDDGEAMTPDYADGREPGVEVVVG